MSAVEDVRELVQINSDNGDRFGDVLVYISRVERYCAAVDVMRGG